MTNLASSIQVSEEALRVGAEMLCHNHSMLAGDEDAWRLHVDEARSIYLAMRSKDHSIAVDDVRRMREALRRIGMPEGNERSLMPSEMRMIARDAITAIGSQSIEGEREIAREKCPYVLPEAMRGMQCPNCDCAEGRSRTLSTGGKK